MGDNRDDFFFLIRRTESEEAARDGQSDDVNLFNYFEEGSKERKESVLWNKLTRITGPRKKNGSTCV